jgi:hypothetical protein
MPKAVLVTAAARYPASVGFSDVKKDLQSPELAERLRTDVFVFHGYSELYVEDSWEEGDPGLGCRTMRAVRDSVVGPGAPARRLAWPSESPVRIELPPSALFDRYLTTFPHFLGGQTWRSRGTAPQGRGPRATPASSGDSCDLSLGRDRCGWQRWVTTRAPHGARLASDFDGAGSTYGRELLQWPGLPRAPRSCGIRGRWLRHWPRARTPRRRQT